MVTSAQDSLLFGEGFDFTDPDLLEKGVPVEQFAQLRQTAPVWFCRQPDNIFDDDGYWVISRHRDVLEVSRDNDQWRTSIKGTLLRPPEIMAPDVLAELNQYVLINNDGANHLRLRKLVSQLFTPRAVSTLETKLATAARRIVAEAAEKDAGDFVDDIAMRLPLAAIADLIGVPEVDRHNLYEWTNAVMNFDDPDMGDPVEANTQMMAYSFAMAEERRRNPADDIITRLIQKQDDGDQLSDLEFAFWVLVLAVSGNETTRNAITHGMNGFLDHPEQWELFKRERPASAVEEIVRWATPVHVIARAAATDTELGGAQIKAGDRVGLFYSSANFDEAVFDRPFTFNIMRSPNPHVGFGGKGAHHCMGANLARMEIRLIFNEIADQIPDIAKLAPPVRVRSGWLNGLKGLDVAYA